MTVGILRKRYARMCERDFPSFAHSGETRFGKSHKKLIYAGEFAPTSPWSHSRRSVRTPETKFQPMTTSVQEKPKFSCPAGDSMMPRSEMPKNDRARMPTTIQKMSFNMGKLYHRSKRIKPLLEEIGDGEKKGFGEVVPISPLPAHAFFGLAEFRFPAFRICNDEERDVVLVRKEIFRVRAGTQAFYFKTGFFPCFAFRAVEYHFAGFGMSAGETPGIFPVLAFSEADENLSFFSDDYGDANSYGVHIKGMKAGSGTLLSARPE